MKYPITFLPLVLAAFVGPAPVANAQCEDFFEYTLTCDEVRLVNLELTNPYYNYFRFTLEPNPGGRVTIEAWDPFHYGFVQLYMVEQPCGDVLAQDGVPLQTDYATICNFEPDPLTPYELLVHLQGYWFYIRMHCPDDIMPCGPVPVRETTWGQIKALYR